MTVMGRFPSKIIVSFVKFCSRGPLVAVIWAVMTLTHVYAQAGCEGDCCCPPADVCSYPSDLCPPEGGDDGDMCGDKWGYPVPCPPDDDGDDGDDGDGGDGGDGGDECYDKWGNVIACDNGGCTEGSCCNTSNPNYSAMVAQAAGCESHICDEIEYDPDTEKCCDGHIIPKSENCECAKTIRTGSWHISTYYTPIQSDYSGTTQVITLDDNTTITCPVSFITVVKMEGWGAAETTSTSFYIGAYDKDTDSFEKSSCPEGNSDNCLEACISLATRDFSNGKHAYFETAAHHSCTTKTCGRKDDVGDPTRFFKGAHRIDLYVGTKHSPGKGDPEYENFSAFNIPVAVEK